jgi:hypothetical protein
MGGAVCTSRREGVVGWDAFLPEVMQFARGVPDEQAANAVRNAAIEFCRATGYLKRVFYGDLYKGVENYAVQDYDGYVVNMLHGVRVCGRAIPVLTDYPRRRGAWGAYFENPHTLYLFPPPHSDERDGLEVELSVFPSRSSCEIEEHFFEQFGDVIAYGALSHLLFMRGTDWYDPQHAGVNHRRFKDAINRAKVREEKGYQRGPIYMRTARVWY